MVGTGGANKNVNCIDHWNHGQSAAQIPNHRLHHGSRPGSLIPMAMRDSAVASEARAKGGHGVIMNSDNSQLVGFANMTNVNAFIIAFTAPA
jgi:hypothetical protein